MNNEKAVEGIASSASSATSIPVSAESGIPASRAKTQWGNILISMDRYSRALVSHRCFFHGFNGKLGSRLDGFVRLSDDLVAAKSELMLRLNDYFGFSSPDVSRAFVMIDNSVLSSLEEMLGLVERHDLVKSENGDGHPPSSEQVGDGVARGVDYCVSLIELDGISQSHGYLGSEYDVAEAKSLLARSAFRDKVRELFGFDRRLWDDASWLVGLVRCVTESAMDKMDKLKNQVGGKPAKEPVEWCQCGRFLGERGADK